MIATRRPTGLVLKVRGAYKKRDVETKSKQDPYAYIEAHSGEYDEVEKKLMRDPYADGWKWCEGGKRLSAWSVSRFLSNKAKVDTKRLFELGFKDCKELSQ